ncbi:hypothetical protein ACFXHA_45330 [Nocardia sp. NPDC059240]|uniref:hypothetical protein n=1 Tax=Nocardia sp. NPDC059240 TaxID=3346786 RepID=UPI0036BB6A70
MGADHLLVAALDVIAEADPGAVFGAAEVLRGIRPAFDPVPSLDEVEQVLGVLALPTLGGLISVGEKTYRAGAAADDVLTRLSRLAEAVRQVDDDDLDDRY